MKRQSDIFIALLLLVLCNYGVYEIFVKPDNTSSSKWWTYSTFTNSKEVKMEKNIKESKWREVSKRKDKRFEQKNDENSDKKLILFDYPPFEEEKEYPINDKATCGRCEVSYNTSKRREADVVVYHLSGMRQHGVEARSFPGQIYVWMNQESPWTTLNYYKVTFHGYDDQFNLTMTYRRDSDILFPYFTLNQVAGEILSDEKLSNGIYSLLARKKKLSVWFGGDCGIIAKGTTRRMRILLGLLEAGLKVDVFGACALRSLDGGWISLPEHVDGYKFFLSFENSFHCRDYITEKTWWNALRSGLVPVIWGPTRQDVEAVLSENSFLFVEDFDTPRALVDRLHYFDDHMVEYVKFFAWRKKLDSRHSYHASQSEMVGFCQLCRMLHDDDKYEKEHGVKPVRMVPSAYDWWYQGESDVCLMPRDLVEEMPTFLDYFFLGEIYFRLLSWKRFYLIATVASLIALYVYRVKVCRVRVRWVRGHSPMLWVNTFFM